MRLVRRIEDIEDALKGGVVALGNFDGFHRGHQVVIGEAGRIAREKGVPLCVMVTEPHPVAYFKPDTPPFRLSVMRERAEMLEHFGVDVLLVLAFDEALARTTAEDFIDRVLVRGLGVCHVVVGFDYRFGAGRKGSADMLQTYGQSHAFGVSVMEAVRVGIDGFAGEIYSSSTVREALREGKPRRAAALLGHWWTISGHVVSGDQRGRTIGFATANIELGDRIEPKLGVYAVRLIVTDTVRVGTATAQAESGSGVPEVGRVYAGVANLGKRPTFDKRDTLLEVHVLDAAPDLYGRHVRVELVGFIRPERKFDGLDALKAQIADDVVTARTVLADPENARERLTVPRLDDYLARTPTPPAQLKTE